jgi:bifunctional non-homologous end joining protein LigD
LKLCAKLASRGWSKRRHSPYAGELNGDWLKVKCMRVHDFVVGDGLRTAIVGSALVLLGEFVDGYLRYVGQVCSPSDSRLIRAAARVLIPCADSPFKDAVGGSGARFCEPALRVGVEFLDFTDDGYLRRPAFRRLDNELTTAF